MDKRESYSAVTVSMGLLKAVVDGWEIFDRLNSVDRLSKKI